MRSQAVESKQTGEERLKVKPDLLSICSFVERQNDSSEV